MKTLIFEDGKYFKSCHASTLLALENGDLLCAYFAGEREGSPDVGIWLSRRVGGTWLAPVCVAKGEPVAHWNPVLFACDGYIRLVYKTGVNVPSWRSCTRVSLDGGESFSGEFLYPQPHEACGPVRSKPLELDGGVLIAPNSVETKEDWLPFVDISYDGGNTFIKLADIPINKKNPDKANYFVGLGAIQPALWKSPDGIHAFLRTTEGEIFRSDSTDNGKTWCEAYKTGLPNNNSGIETVQDGADVYLVLNPVGSKGMRYPITILKSPDYGRHFELFMELERKPTAQEMEDARRAGEADPSFPYAGRIEYSYPAAVIRDKKLYVSYTYNRRQIAVWEIDL